MLREWYIGGRISSLQIYIQAITQAWNTIHIGLASYVHAHNSAYLVEAPGRTRKLQWSRDMQLSIHIAFHPFPKLPFTNKKLVHRSVVSPLRPQLETRLPAPKPSQSQLPTPHSPPLLPLSSLALTQNLTLLTTISQNRLHTLLLLIPSPLPHHTLRKLEFHAL